MGVGDQGSLDPLSAVEEGEERVGTVKASSKPHRGDVMYSPPIAERDRNW